MDKPNDTLTPEQALERMSDMGIRLLDGLAEKWASKGLPSGLLARTMIAVGVGIMEGGEGPEAAIAHLADVGEALAEKYDRPTTAH